MSQGLIEALDALESQVAALSGAVKAADPTEIGKKAEDGARRGASAAVSGLREITLSLQETARGLDDATRALRKYALPAAQRAREAEQRRRWWKPALMVLTVLLGLLSGFMGGVAATRSGLTMGTEIGCHYLGGKWTPMVDTENGVEVRSYHACLVK